MRRSSWHSVQRCIAHRAPVVDGFVAVPAVVRAPDAVDGVRRVGELHVAANQPPPELHRTHAAVAAGALVHQRRELLTVAARAGFVRRVGAMAAIVGADGVAVLALVVEAGGALHAPAIEMQLVRKARAERTRELGLVADRARRQIHAARGEARLGQAIFGVAGRAGGMRRRFALLVTLCARHGSVLRLPVRKRGRNVGEYLVERRPAMPAAHGTRREQE
jgi:hypothetical protein